MHLFNYWIFMQLPKNKTDDSMMPTLYKVVARHRENHDTYSLTLERSQITGADKSFKFLPGQINMLYAYGMGEVPISISSDPSNPHQITHTIRSVGPITQALERLTTNECIGVRGPYGTPWPFKEAEEKDVVIIAGGIGLAPLRPLIYHLQQHRKNYGQIALFYGARSPKDLLFEKELHQWRGRFDMEVEVTVDHAKGDWFGHVGVVTTLFSKVSFDPVDSIAVMCGPEIMMRYPISELKKLGMETKQMYASMERNMKCAVGLCGHCQLGPYFICKDGPVFRVDDIEMWMKKREI